MRRVSDRQLDFDPVLPRERLMLHGPSELRDEELLSILLASGGRGRPVAMLSAELLALGKGGWDDWGRRRPEAYSTVPGVGMAKAGTIARELTWG